MAKKIEDMTESEFSLYLIGRRKKVKDPRLRDLFVQLEQAYYSAGGALLHLAEGKPNEACLRDDVRGLVVHAGRCAGITRQSVPRILAQDRKALASVKRMKSKPLQK